MHDVVVVGAGPAGATAALAALRTRPGARVLLLDRADFPRDKCCGDGVAPHALDVLARLGAGDLLADLPRVRHLELSVDGATAARPMRRAAWVVPRRELDARLVATAVAAGAELRRHRVRTVTVRPGHVEVDDDVPGRVVVAADGAHSAVRAALGLPGPTRRALALRAYVPTPADVRGRQVVRFAHARAYAWAFDRGDGWANVGYGEVLDPDGRAPGRARLQERLHDLLGVGDDARDWLGHHLPLSTSRLRQPDGRVLLAGDAAALVNPLTGEGIAYAVATGALAGRLAVEAPPGGDGPGRAYRAAVGHLLGRHVRATALVAGAARAPRVLAAGVRASAAHQGVFDDLVELGLGRGLLTPRVAGAVLARTLR